MTQLLDPPTSDTTVDRVVDAVAPAEPVTWRSFRGQREPRFGRTAERECAELLDEHGIGWEHEPVTFVLQTDDDGRVSEVIRPHFYLPELNLFLEVPGDGEPEGDTRRLVRKLRQRHPDVNVRVFARRDVEVFARRVGGRGRTVPVIGGSVPDDGLLVG